MTATLQQMIERWETEAVESEREAAVLEQAQAKSYGACILWTRAVVLIDAAAQLRRALGLAKVPSGSEAT